MKNSRVLVVDDDPAIIQAYCDALKPAVPEMSSRLAHFTDDGVKSDVKGVHFNFEVETATQGSDAVAMTEQALKGDTPFAVAFIDIRMPPGMDGLETAKRIRELDERIYLVIVTAYVDRAIDEIQYALSHDALFIRKPISQDEIRQLARNACISWDRRMALHHKSRILFGDGDLDSVRLGDCVEKRLTILFTDIRGFTTLSEQMEPEEVFRFLNTFLGKMVPIIHKHGGVIDKFIGDAIMALFDGPADHAVAASVEMLQALQTDPNMPVWQASEPRIGIGLNTGIVMLGTVGSAERIQRTVIGDTVNSASRTEALTKSYQTPLIITEATYNALKNPSQFHIRFIDRIRVRGKLRPQSIYEVFDHDPKHVLHAKEVVREVHEQALSYYHMRDIEDAVELLAQCQSRLPDDVITELYLERCANYTQNGIHEGTGELEVEVLWRDAYSIGIPVVDQQHKQLLHLINQVSILVHRNEGGDLNGVLDALGHYAMEHFQTEEALMRDHNYPLFREHVEEHRRFAESYGVFREELLSKRHGKRFLLFKINLFLVDWLITHTAKSDRHMGKHLARLGVAIQ
ncbi:MAG: bacteriohemerythrin [Magnetococcales bacterium]|nr:bacteriohemerythrin [Magnetococcales bacterium]